MGDRTLRARLVAEDRASSVIKGVSGAFTALGGIAAAVGLTALGRQFVDGMQAAVSEAAKAEVINAKAAQSIRNIGGDVATVLPQLQAMAARFQDLTGVEDDAILAGQTLLVSLGRLAGDGLERATAAALDLGSFLGNNEQAFQIVAKAAAGHTRALAQFGITVDKNLPPAERLNEVLTKLEDRFAGQAQARLNTFTGRVEEMNNAWGNLLETLGQPLLEVAKVFTAELLTPTIKQLDEAAKSSTLYRDAVLDIGIAAARTTAGVAGMIAAFGEWHKQHQGFLGFISASIIQLSNFEEAMWLAGVASGIFDETRKDVEALPGPFARVAESANRVVQELERLKAVGPELPKTIAAPIAEVGEEAEKTKTALEQLGINLDELKNRGTLISQAFQEIGSAVASGLRPEQAEALNEKLREMAQALIAEGGLVQGFEFVGVSAGATFLTLSEAVQLAVTDLDLMLARIEQAEIEIVSLGKTITTSLKQVGVNAAVAFGDALVDAAFGAEISFRDFFKQLIKDLLKAIVQALILRAILGISTGGAGAAVGGAAVGFHPVALRAGGIIGARSGFLVSGVDGGRDSTLIAGRPGEAVLPKELTDFLMDAAVQGGRTEIVIRIESDIPQTLRRINEEVRGGGGTLQATRLAGRRAVRTGA